MALKQVKNKIIATKKTAKVTKAMEAVSAVKMRKSQERALSGRPFAEAALRILKNISESVDARAHHLFNGAKGTRQCIIVITSDKGLAGSLNSAVLKEANVVVRREKKEDTDVICFGRKAYEHYNHRGYAIPLHYINVSDSVNVEEMEEVVSYVTSAFAKGEYKNVTVVFQNFISTFEQKPRVHQILPIITEDVQKLIKHILPKKGKYSDAPVSNGHIAYTTEQSAENLYDSVFSVVVEIMLYHALLESKASEHSARMVAMKNATDKAKEFTKSLTLLYNKQRQAAITAEVSEISGGMEAMKK
jgi:F-type H+-transporting ATPase subunit gamma